MSHPFQQWENALSSMSEVNEDMKELVSKWKEMLASQPHCVDFQFFDGTMYSIPNFAKMLQQMTTWSTENVGGALVQRGEDGGINVGSVTVGDDSGTGMFTPDGIIGTGWGLDTNGVHGSTGSGYWTLSKDEVRGDGWELNATIYNALKPQKITRYLYKIESGTLWNLIPKPPQNNVTVPGGDFILRWDTSENNLFGALIAKGGRGMINNVDNKNEHLLSRQLPEDEFPYRPYMVVISTKDSYGTIHCLTGFTCAETSEDLLVTGIFDKSASQGLFAGNAHNNELYSIDVFYR